MDSWVQFGFGFRDFEMIIVYDYGHVVRIGVNAGCSACVANLLFYIAIFSGFLCRPISFGEFGPGIENWLTVLIW